MSTSPPGLPLEPLIARLATDLPEFSGGPACTATLLAAGRSNLTYAVTDCAGRRWAIRRPPLGHIMPSAHDMRREFTVLSGLSRAAYPVPRPRLLCQDHDVIGADFLVMDFVDGTVISDRDDAARLTEREAGDASALLVDGLARLHSLDAQAIGLGEFGRPDGYLVRQVRRWGQQWELSKTRDLPSLDAVGAWLAREVEQLPADLPWSIVHGDFRIDNAIIAPTFTELRAVVDWEMSTLGDPVADLAVTLVYWTQADDHLRRAVPVAQDVTSGPGFWSRRRIADEYARATGRDLSHLGFCLVFACYKLAVIMASLDFRSAQGHQLGRTAELGEDMAGAVDALAELGLHLMDSPSVEALAQ